ncbi:MAG: two-component system, OmpR family, response regulator [Betaproteobacteria bacterium]
MDNRVTILCVDNDDESRCLLAELLAGYRVVFACNAFEGLRELHTGIFNAYLLEYSLPDWSGAQLCQQIRKVDPHAPVLFCSAAARAADRDCAMRAGGSAYLCKPIHPSRLLAQLRMLLELSDRESIRARLDAERATQEELERSVVQVFKRSHESRKSALRAVERVSRAKASIAFARSGGTRANFERWWPAVFAAAWANIQAPMELPGAHADAAARLPRPQPF